MVEIRTNEVIHCKTEEEARELLNWMDSIGRKWSNNTSYKNLNWDTYKQNTCYHLYNNSHSDLDYAKRYKYKIIPFHTLKNKTYEVW